MTVTTGMLMEGKMSTVMVTMAATPRTAIKRAMTTNVYGRRSASRTIHICVWCFGAPTATARTRMRNVSARIGKAVQEPWPRSAGLRILAEIARAAPTLRAHSASGGVRALTRQGEVRVMRRHRKAAALALGLVIVGTVA